MVFVTCPKCGRKVCQAENGSTVKILCQKCRHTLMAEVADDKVLVSDLTKDDALASPPPRMNTPMKAAK